MRDGMAPAIGTARAGVIGALLWITLWATWRALT